MKKNLSLLCVFIFFLGASGMAQITYDTETDIEGKSFRTITINKEVGLGVKYSHIWTADNLNYSVDSGSYCYDDDPANCRRYGWLYTWQAGKEACTRLEKGWRLPSDLDWQRLMHQFSEGGLISGERGNEAAYRALIEGGESQFNALLGGTRDRDGEYFDLGRYGFYWSATEVDAVTAWYYGFNGDDERVGRNGYFKSDALSCRCLKADN